MTEYALFFETGGPIFGEGYVAVVRLRGRLLAAKSPTDVELYGVNPGGAAACAPTLAEAYARLVDEFRVVLVDIAADGCDFAGFRRRARGLFDAAGHRTEARWQRARELARRGEVDTELGLRIERDDPEIALHVELVEKATPAANLAPQETGPTALAA